jgi:hypothetical protein
MLSIGLLLVLSLDAALGLDALSGRTTTDPYALTPVGGRGVDHEAG